MKRLICLALLPLSLTGCRSIMHELQPHRLWRMNYADSPGRSDGAYFSVEDELRSSERDDGDTDAIDNTRGDSRR